MAAGKTQLQSPLLGVVAMAIIAATAPSPALAQYLSDFFYAETCPPVFDIVQAEVKLAIAKEARMGASLIRLFFHDCFVNGCDGSVLLEDTGSFVGERTAFPNRNSLRGFSVIDSIKAKVDWHCGPGVVSCADIVAIAARDSVDELGGPYYFIPVGRRDARTASLDAANRDLPPPTDDLNSLISSFSQKGFTPREMVALYGAHTVGFARCINFRTRIYNETNIDPAFAAALKASCPAAPGQGDSNLAPLDATPSRFDNNYFQLLTEQRGLLHSDQVLFDGGSTDALVNLYRNDSHAFAVDFANAMVKMGYLGPLLTGSQGEIRNDCKRVN